MGLGYSVEIPYMISLLFQLYIKKITSSNFKSQLMFWDAFQNFRTKCLDHKCITVNLNFRQQPISQLYIILRRYILDYDVEKGRA